MSHPNNDALASQAETEAIEYYINKGIDQNNPVFDKMVDIKAEKIFEELMNRPGSNG